MVEEPLSPVFLVYLFLMLVLIAVSLVMLTFYSTSSESTVSLRGLKKILSVALLMPAAALPLMFFLFLILPRTQFPLWNFLNIAGARVTGFSEKVEPGSASTVDDIKKVAFRANSARLPNNLLYWRGIVLNAFEGNAWVRKEMPHGEEGATVKGEVICQTIYPEPGRVTYLVALNVPRTISGVRYSRENDYTYTAKGGGTGRIKYEAVSVAGDAIETKRGLDRNFYLKVPERVSQRMIDLGMGIAGKGKSDAEIVSLLEGEFIARKLTYATTKLPVGEFPLDEFLFEKRRGHCEFFASSFATLLRLAGVPARLVGGYLGGEYNDLGGYYVVTDDMAHVWVEAYISGKGWVKIDPSRWAVNFPGAREQGHRSFAQRLGMTIDAFSYYWNLSVINYDLERQLTLLNNANIGLKGLSLQAFLRMALYLAILPFIIASAVIVAKKWGTSSREERVLAKFLRKVKRVYQIEVSPETGLHELAAILDNPVVSRFVTLYGSAVYHDRKLEPEEMRELDMLIRSVKESKIRRPVSPALLVRTETRERFR